MMTGKVKYLFSLVLLMVVGLVSCVHEFPSPFPATMTIHLKFDMDLPFFKDYYIDTRAGQEQSYRQRYVMQVFPLYDDGTNGSTPVLTHTWFGNDINNPDTEVAIDIPAGKYRFAFWSDIVLSDGDELYYDASRFSAITYTSTYVGNTDFRDAFRGTLDFTIESDTYEGRVYDEVVNMTRPVAKYMFVTSDVEQFKDQYVRLKRAEGIIISRDDVDLSKFTIVFFYSGYMPNTYNIFSDRPVDSATGVSFRSSITMLESGEACLGFDYTMVRTTESSVLVTVGLFDEDGTQISISPGVEVPLMRSKYTVVRGRFLTVGASSGVAINPEFDGELNIMLAD